MSAATPRGPTPSAKRPKQQTHEDAIRTDFGVSDAHMRAVMSMAARVAGADSTVLLMGETGVGKERLAKFIHTRSNRSRAPFLAINCGALTETLLESELFGYRRGAFTGAVADRPGMFEAAHGGTLLLDEVGEMPLQMQAALLRVLQEREVRRVGDHHPRPIDVRILAATNRDLDVDVDTRQFRRDLYYRLSVFVLRIPPLRERPDDLVTLALALLTSTAARLHRPITAYTPRALRQLRSHAWPGNIRELQNAIEHACVLADGSVIDLQHLPSSVLGTSRTPTAIDQPTRPLREIERDYILTALARVGGNRRLAAAQLKIGVATLQRKLIRYRRA